MPLDQAALVAVVAGDIQHVAGAEAGDRAVEGARVVEHGPRIRTEGERLIGADGRLQGERRPVATASVPRAHDAAVEQQVAAGGRDRAVVVDVGQHHGVVAAAVARDRARAGDKAARGDVDGAGAHGGVGAAQRDLAGGADRQRAGGREQGGVVGALANGHRADAGGAADRRSCRTPAACCSRRCGSARCRRRFRRPMSRPLLLRDRPLCGADGDFAAVLDHQDADAAGADDQGAGGCLDIGDQQLAAVERDRPLARRPGRRSSH